MISDARLRSGPGFEMDSLKKLALITVICAVARHFGYPRLRTSQLKAIVAFCQGKDVFVSLPTGFGKTLIYALLPALFNLLRAVDSSIVMVVSPLVALMAEQKCKFVPMGINAEFLGELQVDATAIQRVTQGLHSLVLVIVAGVIFAPTVLMDSLTRLQKK